MFSDIKETLQLDNGLASNDIVKRLILMDAILEKIKTNDVFLQLDNLKLDDKEKALLTFKEKVAKGKATATAKATKDKDKKSKKSN